MLVSNAEDVRAAAIFSQRFCKEDCGGNSVVECHLAKVDVMGSSPIRRSKFLNLFGLAALKGVLDEDQ